MTGPQCIERAPVCGGLSRFVEAISVTQNAPGASERVLLPDGRACFIFHVREQGAGHGPDEGAVYAAGPRTHVRRKAITDVRWSIAVRFRPGGAYPFFDAPLNQVMDKYLRLEELWGGDGTRLRDRLLEAPTMGARLGHVEDALEARMRRKDATEPASAKVARLAARLMSEGPAMRIDALSHRFGLGPRQFLRIFDESIGVGPKVFARFVRFQRAIRAAESSSAPHWVAIAGAAGYYDQAHMIAEFRRLSGMTPRAFVASLRGDGGFNRARELRAVR